jgi:hypothetical protein
MVGLYIYTQNCFGKNLGQKNIFDEIFGRSAEISAAEAQFKFQKLNIFGKKFQIFMFFLFQIGPEYGQESQKNKNNFQSLK